MKRMSSDVLKAVAACGLLLVGFGCVNIPGVGPDGVVDLDTLLQTAVQMAQDESADAIVFHVDGVNGASLTVGSTGSETLEYSFYAICADGSAPMWVIVYDRATDTWTMDETTPIVGQEYYDLLDVEMTESEARTLLAGADYEDTFWGWSLFKPLHPDFPNALYSFTFEDRTVFIDTVTEEVTESLAAEPTVTFGAEPGEDSVSLQMIAAANDQIKAIARSAFIVYAAGRDGDGNALNEASDTNVWDFLAVFPDDNDIRAWELTYDGEWTVEEVPVPYLGIEYYDLTAVTVDVVEAWAAAVEAGVEPPFESWALYKSVNPDSTEPAYVFHTADGYVIVSMTADGDFAVVTNTGLRYIIVV